MVMTMAMGLALMDMVIGMDMVVVMATLDMVDIMVVISNFVCNMYGDVTVVIIVFAKYYKTNKKF